MKYRGLSVAVAVVGLAAGAVAAQTVSSQFESGLEGWTSANNGSFGPTWIPATGADDGHIEITDSTTGWCYLAAPGAFTAQPALYGGTFSFDLKHFAQGDPVAYGVRVGITGAGFNLINEATLPTTQWVNYSFTLNASSGWRKFSNLSQNYTTSAPAATVADMQAALAGITGLYIAADYTSSYAPADIDRTWIDNVVLTVVGPSCDSIDYNGDGLFPDTSDIDDFLSVFSGGPCSTGSCGDIDFNNDGLFPDTMDIEALLSVFSGGPCL